MNERKYCCVMGSQPATLIVNNFEKKIESRPVGLKLAARKNPTKNSSAVIKPPSAVSYTHESVLPWARIQVVPKKILGMQVKLTVTVISQTREPGF